MPSDYQFSSIEFSARSSVTIGQSIYTFEQQAQVNAGKIWMARVSLPSMDRARSEKWAAFLSSLNGMQGTFYLGDPAGASPQGSGAGTPLVNGASQTGQTLATKGWTASQTGVLLAGDWIQLGTGSISRLYKVLQDVSSDGAGLASVEIWPSIRESPNDNDAVVITNARGVFRLTSNIRSWNIAPPFRYGVQFEAMEAL